MKPTADAGLAFCPNLPVVGLDNCFADGQAQATAPNFACRGTVHLVESIKDVVQVLWLNAEALIGHTDLYTIGKGLHCDSNRPSPGRVLYSILHQVAHYLPGAPRVSPNQRQR
jgi:hypothetical protein